MSENLNKLIFEALGEASMCWSETPKGVFDSNQATEIGNRLLAALTEENLGAKTLSNTTASQAKDNVKDIVFWGNGDAWKLLGKASSKNEGWMKSSKAYEIPQVGCIVQVTTQQGDNVAEAVTFVPGVRILERTDSKDGGSTITSRSLIEM